MHKIIYGTVLVVLVAFTAYLACSFFCGVAHLRHDRANDSMDSHGAAHGDTLDSRIFADNTLSQIADEPVYFFNTLVNNTTPDTDTIVIPFENRVAVPEENANNLFRVHAGLSGLTHCGSNTIERTVGLQGAVYGAGSGDLGEAWGLYGEVMVLGEKSGSITEAVGLRSRINPHSHGIGKIINAYGVKADLRNDGKQGSVQNYYGFGVSSPFAGAENFFGVYVDGTSQAPGANYNFYSAGKESSNLFEGTVQIGSLSGSGNAAVCVDSDGKLFRVSLGGDSKPVEWDNTGLLGNLSNSMDPKVNIRDAGPLDTGYIYDLRPVMYNYKGQEHGISQCGLLAEEAAAVRFDIVGYRREVTPAPVADAEAESATDTAGASTTDVPVTVNYHELIVPMLAEMQRLRHRVDELETRLATIEGQNLP